MKQTPPITMVVRHLSPQDKQETADMEPVSDAHMMLIDRCLPQVLHTESGSVLTHNAGPAGHYCTATEVPAWPEIHEIRVPYFIFERTAYKWIEN